MKSDSPIEVFSTCPPSSRVPKEQYLERLIDIAQWSESAGCTGILVFSDNSLLDPWALSHLIIQHTRTLRPLVAIQPVYMHPYWVAKQITTLSYLHGRRLDLNMVAGGFKNDLEALSDSTPHDQRYTRLTEYTTVIMRLLTNGAPVSYDGEFHRVSKLKLQPPLLPDLVPDVFVSGSSEAGIAAARTLGAVAIKYPKPSAEEAPQEPSDLRLGIRVGILARPTESDAWDVAQARFHDDRKGQITRQLAEKVSDSVWHKQLAGIGPAVEGSVYWLTPFQNYQAMCPYLVGSYAQVADELARYFGAGYRSIILDTPPDPEELTHTFEVLDAALHPVQ
ncbi:MAG TPA: LLM class flavin-dependent oxidoreductase [Vicinamibacterales bacterium]|jgi:alkanesulfonate monooxygenase